MYTFALIDERSLIPFITPDTLETMNVVTITAITIPHITAPLFNPVRFWIPPAIVSVPVPRDAAIPATSVTRQITSTRPLYFFTLSPSAGTSADPIEYGCFIL